MKRTLVIGTVLIVTAASPAAGQTLAQAQAGDDFADMLQTAAENIARMKAAHKQVADKVDEARNEKDVVKLNCVNEKLTQVKGLLRVAEQAESALREAIAAKDDGADAEYAKIGIARSKVEGLRGEADQCTGQLAYMVDEKTTVEVEQPSAGVSDAAPSLGVATRLEGERVASATTMGTPDDGGSGLDGSLGSLGGSGTSATAGTIGGGSDAGSGGASLPAFTPPPVTPPPPVSPFF